jgi:hypothetical protein
MERATQEQITGWKAQYGEIFEVELEKDADSEPTYAYFRKPARHTVANVMRKMAGQDLVDANQVLINDCFVGGDEVVKTDVQLMLGAGSALQVLITPAAASLKNL